MRYLVDGHNLISKLPGLSLSMPDDEQRLIEILRRYCLHGRHQVEVFFDAAPFGQAGTYNFGPVTAHFVRQGLTADDAIHQRLAALKRSARTRVVVTSDRSVQAAAREAHAGIVSSEDFVDSIQVSAQAARDGVETRADKPLSEAEVQEWLAIFKQRPKGGE